MFRSSRIPDSPSILHWLLPRHQLAALLLLYCPLSVNGHGFGAPHASHFIGPGDEVILNQSIQTTSGARIYLQNGKVVSRTALKHRAPFCYFFAYRDPAVIATGLTLHPDRFSVIKVHNQIEYSGDVLALFQYASSSLMDYSAENLITRIRITSKNHSTVRELKCGIFAVPFERHYLNLKEIQNALGRVVSLRLKQ